MIERKTPAQPIQASNDQAATVGPCARTGVAGNPAVAAVRSRSLVSGAFLARRIASYLEELESLPLKKADREAACRWKRRLGDVARRCPDDLLVEDVLEVIPSYERWRSCQLSQTFSRFDPSF